MKYRIWRASMKLHQYKKDFDELCNAVASQINLPINAIKMDYFIVLSLQKLQNSAFFERCVFKGGTSLSKCYPGSIERFSEDIDLTYMPEREESGKKIETNLKLIEKVMTDGFVFEPIVLERTSRNKSGIVHFDIEGTKIKLEIGSSVIPEPYSKKTLSTYIQQFLESRNDETSIIKYELVDITLNVLDITRTFIDKVMAVKRHALCGTLNRKVRHIYDVTKLYQREDIQVFLNDASLLKNILQKVKQTDSVYLEKRSACRLYNPLGAYDFDAWQEKLDSAIKQRYESLSEDLLYTKEKQDFNVALATFKKISTIFASVKE